MLIKIFIAGRKGADKDLVSTNELVVEAATDKKDSSFNGIFQKAIMDTILRASDLKIPVRTSRLHLVVVGEDEGNYVTCDWSSQTTKSAMMLNFKEAWKAFCALVLGHGEDLELRKTTLPLFIELAGKFAYTDHKGEVVIERLLSAQAEIFTNLAKRFENEVLEGKLDVLRSDKFKIVETNERNKELKTSIKDLTEQWRVKLIASSAASNRAGQP